jgi:hypothetical protein
VIFLPTVILTYCLNFIKHVHFLYFILILLTCDKFSILWFCTNVRSVNANKIELNWITFILHRILVLQTNFCCYFILVKKLLCKYSLYVKFVDVATKFCIGIIFAIVCLFGCMAYPLTMKMEAVQSSETLVNFWQTTLCSIPEYDAVCSHCHQNHKCDAGINTTDKWCLTYVHVKRICMKLICQICYAFSPFDMFVIFLTNYVFLNVL